jgi:hypothetical protein
MFSGQIATKVFSLLDAALNVFLGLLCFLLVAVVVSGLTVTSIGIGCLIQGLDSSNFFCNRNGDPSFPSLIGGLPALLAGVIAIILFLVKAPTGSLRWRLGWNFSLFALASVITPANAAVYGPLERSAEALTPKIAASLSLADPQQTSSRKGSQVVLTVTVVNTDTRPLTLRALPGCLGFVQETYSDGTSKIHYSKGEGCSATEYKSRILAPGESFSNPINYRISPTTPSGKLTIEVHETAWFDLRIGRATASIELEIS